MATPIFQKGLKLFIEAEEHGGTNGAVVSSVADLSPGGRNLVCASNKPTVKTGAINGKRSFNFDGTNNPLVYTGEFTIRCGFLVVKADGNFGSEYEGILSSPDNFGILVGIGGSNLLYNFQYNYYEYRLNDRIYPKNHAIAPTTGFGIIYFKFWQNLNLEGIQIGQDRDDADSKFDGEIALMALYERDFFEPDVRLMTQSIANSYQLALPDVFPYWGSKGDARTISKRILTDGQDEPITRVKRGARQFFDLNFLNRRQSERVSASRFWDDFFPTKRFIFRDYANIPPVDTICRIPEDSEFEWSGNLINDNSYKFQVIESNVAPATSIPPAPIIPDETEPPDGDALLIDGDALLIDGAPLLFI